MAAELSDGISDFADLTEEEVRLLDALWRKGPAMPMELAVRTMSLPEDITQPLAQLEQKGLIEVEDFDGGSVAQKLVFLSKRGAYALKNRHR